MTAPLEPAYRKRVSYQGGLLGGFATLAAALIVMGNIATYDTIALRNAEDLQRSLSHVIPADVHDNDLLEDPLTLEHEGKDVIVYRGTRMLKTKAVAFIVSAQGYSGEISMIMGIDQNGEILGVRILSHAETPGLGDKIEVEKDAWVYSFDGLSLAKVPQEKWKVKKDGGIFDQFTGATITPRAVVKAAREGLQLFSQHRGELLAEMPANDNPTQTTDLRTRTVSSSDKNEAEKHGE
ncbi:MAG: electron transport complex subunit RsxG [Gammaproteobacteria bacterium]